MARIEKSIEINASPEKIWPFLSWERSHKWYKAFKTVNRTSKEKGAIGETYHVTGEVAGTKAQWGAETTELIQNQRIMWRSIGGDFTGFGTHTLTPTNTGTKVTIMMDYDMPYSILGKLLDKLKFHRAFEKTISDGLTILRTMAER